MGIKMDKCSSADPVLKLRPGDDPRICRIPAFAADLFGCLREPERIASHNTKSVLSIKYRGVFAPLFAIRAAHADPCKAGQKLFKVAKLRQQGLLHANDIGLVKTNDIRDFLFPVRPRIHAVTRLIVSYVKGHYADRRRLSRKSDLQTKKRKNDSGD